MRVNNSYNKVKCSVIILSYNTREITDRCLSLVEISKKNYEKLSGESLEVIVTENGSRDGSVDLIKRKYPWINLIQPGINTGFAKGNNLAMKDAQGEYFLLLNSDAFIKESTFYETLKFMESHTGCDVLGCKLTNEDGSLQPSTGFLPTPINIITWMLAIDKLPYIRDKIKSFHPNHRSFFKKVREVEWVTGAFMLLRRRVYEETGGFDENFFMYTEEVEWCKRIKERGFKVYYNPEFEAIHLLRASSGYDIKKPILKEAQGVIFYFRKHYSNFVWEIKLLLIIGYFWRMLFARLIGNSKKAEAYSLYLFGGG